MPCSAANAQSRAWEFTVNNYTDDDVKWVEGLEAKRKVVSKEIGESGTPHLQGHVTFYRKYTLLQLKKLNEKAHWEQSKCTADHNYVKKRGSDLIIDENNSKQGKRTDIQTAREILQTTGSIREVVKQTEQLHTIQYAEKYMKYMEPVRPVGPITVTWIYGSTGTGKTRFVFDTHDADTVFQPLTHKWWDGYDGHKIVLIDDLRPDWCTFAELLRLIDIYPFRVECKGGSRQCLADVFYITCPKHPHDLFKEVNEDLKQLTRRLSKILHFEGDTYVDVTPSRGGEPEVL